MTRTVKVFSIDKPFVFKERLLLWAQQFESVIWLDSNQHQQTYTSYDGILAVDEFTSIKTDTLNAFKKLQEYQSITNDYLFGYLSYDVKNDIEKLSSENFDGLDFSDIYFFQPKKIVFVKGNSLEFHYLKMVDDEIESDFKEIEGIKNSKIKRFKDLKIKARTPKIEYFKKVTETLNHIYRGDIYEVNLCQEFYAENVIINPLDIYQHLNGISKTPFATFLKIEHQYLLSASPERYLKKQGTKIISQPIKGTAKRLTNKEKDTQIALDLSQDKKEQSENVMIVDLVRNDLSKTAKKGSVQVEELCKVYTFEQVHQLISTIVSEVPENTNPIDILRNTFPMGSMTGAPKIAAMKMIEKLENTKRGLYSGTVGYFTPNGDFDFNVVIRSILYNQEKKYASFSVGSAITAKSTPKNEYEECLLKAKAMKFVLLHSE